MSKNQAPYLGDLQKTTILHNLFQVPFDNRDAKWKKEFLMNVEEASFAAGNPQVVQGPDGYPYFVLSIPEPQKEFQCFVIKHMTDDFLLREGFGVVINLQKGEPDWVFSYGDVVNYHLRNEFFSFSKEWNLEKEAVIKDEEEVMVGPPSELILPKEARMAVKKYLESVGINDAKVLLMTRKKAGGIFQELVFNLTPDRFEGKEIFEQIMGSIAWFLPRHYSYVSMKESSDLGNGFEAI